MHLTCYHTVEDQENADYIEKFAPFLCKRNDAWLGTGYYFWDSNIDWAHDWGRNYEEYVICAAEISLDSSIFDLYGVVNHQEIFKKAYIALKERVKGEVTVPQVINAMKRLGSFKYNGIRAYHIPKPAQTVKYNSKKNDELFLNQRVQICLINKNNLLSQTFRIVFPEKYVVS